MAKQLQRCLELYPLKDWSELVRAREFEMIGKRSEWPYWTKAVVAWNPFGSAFLNVHTPYRPAGHPQHPIDIE